MRKVSFVALLVAVASCYPGDVTSVSDLDVVLTFQNPNSDVTKFTTYAIPDTVVQIDEDSSAVKVDHSGDDEIIQRVKTNLNAYGWQAVALNQSPDVIVLVSVVADEYTAYTYWPGYWWGYWGWYYPCYYCYPGYPPTVTATNYKAGTLFVDMVDVADRDTTNTADSTTAFPWDAGINGVLSGSSSNLARALSGIDQAFKQSPYLKKN
jgi:hypothetical protein